MFEAARLAGLDTGGDWEFRVWFLDDRAMAQAHVETMNVEGATDVITLAYLEEPEALFPGDMGLELIVGAEVALREGKLHPENGYAGELMLYIVHGCLHAAGENDLCEADRLRMRRREAEVLAVLRSHYDFRAIFPEPQSTPPVGTAPEKARRS